MQDGYKQLRLGLRAHAGWVPENTGWVPAHATHQRDSLVLVSKAAHAQQQVAMRHLLQPRQPG